MILHGYHSTDAHLALFAEIDRKKPRTPPPPPPHFNILPHLVEGDRNFPVFRRGWALFDSWGRVRRVVTCAVKCFLFLLRGSSEARGDHRVKRRWATSGLRWCCHNKKHTSVAGTEERRESETWLFTALRDAGRNMATRHKRLKASVQHEAWAGEGLAFRFPTGVEANLFGFVLLSDRKACIWIEIEPCKIWIVLELHLQLTFSK